MKNKLSSNWTGLRVISSIALILLLFDIIYSLMRNQFPTSPVFWIAATVEGLAAYLAYKLRDRSGKLQALVVFSAYSFALILYYFKLLGLESIIKLVLIHSIVGLAFYIYNPPVIKTPSTKRMLLSLQISSCFYLAILVAAVGGILLMRSNPDFSPIFKAGNPELTIAQFAGTLVAPIALSIGFLLPRFFRWHRRSARTFLEVELVHRSQATLFQMIGIAGFVLFIFGEQLEWLPMTIVSASSQLAIFPTEKRLLLWLGSASEKSDSAM